MTRRGKYEGSLLALIALALCGVFATPLAAQDAAGVFKSKCAMCHGADGKGDTPIGKKMGARDFASPEVQKESDAELAQVITSGRNKMPAYGKSLKEGDIQGLVAYVRQLGKK
jgi:cytochrome c6